MTTEPTVRDVLEAAAHKTMDIQGLGLRPAKAAVHNMPWSSFVKLVTGQYTKQQAASKVNT